VLLCLKTVMKLSIKVVNSVLFLLSRMVIGLSRALSTGGCRSEVKEVISAELFKSILSMAILISIWLANGECSSIWVFLV
jgi:hypothetical protein